MKSNLPITSTKDPAKHVMSPLKGKKMLQQHLDHLQHPKKAL
jgi:hypothetical protein